MLMSIECFTHLHTNLLFDAKKHGCCVRGLEQKIENLPFPANPGKGAFLDETKRKQKHHHNHSIIRIGPSSPLLVTQKQYKDQNIDTMAVSFIIMRMLLFIFILSFERPMLANIPRTYRLATIDHEPSTWLKLPLIPIALFQFLLSITASHNHRT